MFLLLKSVSRMLFPIVPNVFLKTILGNSSSKIVSSALSMTVPHWPAKISLAMKTIITGFYIIKNWNYFWSWNLCLAQSWKNKFQELSLRYHLHLGFLAYIHLRNFQNFVCRPIFPWTFEFHHFSMKGAFQKFLSFIKVKRSWINNPSIPQLTL